MSDQNNEIFNGGDFSKQSLLKEIGYQMIYGGGLGAILFFGIGIFIYIIYFIGTLLPPESKEADDPTPDSFAYYQPYDTDVG